MVFLLFRLNYRITNGKGLLQNYDTNCSIGLLHLFVMLVIVSVQPFGNGAPGMGDGRIGADTKIEVSFFISEAGSRCHWQSLDSDQALEILRIGNRLLTTVNVINIPCRAHKPCH
jgi:hypothetical protein